MKKTMFICAALSGAACAVFTWLGIKPAVITCGTIFYHFAMRLAVGYILLFVPRRFDPKSSWFAQKKWENRFYAHLRVREWKHKVPSFNPKDFDLNLHSPEEILQTMCVSELVHEIIMVLSFVPILFAIPFGELGVFLITSVLSAAVDSVFVILQRFNRPRMLQLAKRMSVNR